MWGHEQICKSSLILEYKFQKDPRLCELDHMDKHAVIMFSLAAIHDCGFEVVQQPPYSPNLTPEIFITSQTLKTCSATGRPHEIFAVSL